MLSGLGTSSSAPSP
uniref:Uncharacterized protein n=1 Tax=Anguilla anguilla TaxID=7936 RepID=A0A0E9TQ11_ANGAN